MFLVIFAQKGIDYQQKLCLNLFNLFFVLSNFQKEDNIYTSSSGKAKFLLRGAKNLQVLKNPKVLYIENLIKLDENNKTTTNRLQTKNLKLKFQ